MNRIGNLFVPNSNYCSFEDWVVPILDKMLEEQEASKKDEEPLHWTPSKVIARLGKEINDERSVYYWAWKNDIPVFCPALTDGSLGDMLYFHTFKSSPEQLRIDIVEDIRKINTIAVRAKRAGMIILGGGIVKHHIANACLMRNGAESAVYINTANEFDGSDAGARPDEAVSWGKIKADAQSVKVRVGLHGFQGDVANEGILGLCRGHCRISAHRRSDIRKGRAGRNKRHVMSDMTGCAARHDGFTLACMHTRPARQSVLCDGNTPLFGSLRLRAQSRPD